MRLRDRIARVISPGLMNDVQVRDMVAERVAEEVARVKAALPVTASYDPHSEGYRRLSGQGGQRRDLVGVSRDRMFEIAYFMWDYSPMTKRMAKMDKGFLFGERMEIASEDEAVQEVIDRFIKDTETGWELGFPGWMMWLSLLGEQCWPVTVNPHNGHVILGYVDPQFIKDVMVLQSNVKTAARVDLQTYGGLRGRRMSVIREDRNPRSATYGRLVGDCFFWALNNPPNDPRGRSDYMSLFDWIDSLERYAYNYLERAEHLMNFVWDVLLKGMDHDQIRQWLQDNPPPEPGSVRAHNEQVEWDAVAPDIKAHDFSAGFDMAKAFILGSAGRPDSWYGGGGKAYQTEAEQFGQVPIKDFDERQQYIRYIVERVIRFVVDQAVIHGRLSEAQAEKGFSVTMPEISKRDLTKLINGVPQLATALAVAEEQSWIRRETATRIFASVCGQIGADVDVDLEIEAAKTRLADKRTGVTEDYAS